MFSKTLVTIAVILLSSPVKSQAFEPIGIKTKVIKAGKNFVLPPAPEKCQSAKKHLDKAGKWIPDRDINIHAVSIPEQSEISIYADIEITTAPEMYLEYGHIFRAKYAGPGIFRSSICESSYLGSNITTTNIVFPTLYAIKINQGTPIYVHMDIINWSPYEIDPMTQDVYIYYSEE